MTKIEYIAIPNIPIVNIGDDISQIAKKAIFKFVMVIL